MSGMRSELFIEAACPLCGKPTTSLTETVTDTAVREVTSATLAFHAERPIAWRQSFAPCGCSRDFRVNDAAVQAILQS